MRVLLIAALMMVVLVGVEARTQKAVVYVWSGQDSTFSGEVNDFVGVFDYDPESATYGDLLTEVPLANTDTTKKSANEPHHSMISADWNYYVTGGLLSFLDANQDEVFVYTIDKENPTNGPTYQYGLNLPGGCTDEFVKIGDHGFLVTQMCSAAAGDPGDIVYFNAETGAFQSLLDTEGDNPNELTGFNPHGFDYNSRHDRIMSTDYILPSSLLTSSADPLVFRNSLREFSWDGASDETANLVETYTAEPFEPEDGQVGSGNGFMDFKFINSDGRYGYACGTNDNQLYLIDAEDNTITRVLDLRVAVGDPDSNVLSAGITQYSKDGTRMLMTFQMRYILLIDISDVDDPEVLQVFDFCTDASVATYPVPQWDTTETTTYADFCANNGNIVGTHYVRFSEGADDDRFTVTNYFLVFELAQFPGTRTVHSFTLNDAHTSFTIDLNFDPNAALANLKASPHSVMYVPLNDDGTLGGEGGDNNSAASFAISFLFLAAAVIFNVFF